MYYWPDWNFTKDQDFTLLGNRVLVRVVEKPTMTASGVALPWDQDEHWCVSDRGVVEKLGHLVTEETREHLKIGDLVIYHLQKGDDYQRDGVCGDHIIILTPEDIHAIIGREGDDPLWF